MVDNLILMSWIVGVGSVGWSRQFLGNDGKVDCGLTPMSLVRFLTARLYLRSTSVPQGNQSLGQWCLPDFPDNVEASVRLLLLLPLPGVYMERALKSSIGDIRSLIDQPAQK